MLLAPDFKLCCMSLLLSLELCLQLFTLISESAQVRCQELQLKLLVGQQLLQIAAASRVHALEQCITDPGCDAHKVVKVRMDAS